MSIFRCPVIRINKIEPHPNADTLGIVRIEGFQCIIKLGEFNEGDLAVYIPPDSIVPEESEYAWLWAGRNVEGPIPERYRRVKAIKLRKEWSEGLLVAPPEIIFLQAGDDAAPRLGITHYNPPEPTLDGTCERGPGQYRKYPKSLTGWWYWFVKKLGFKPNGLTGGDNELGLTLPVYDVENIKNFMSAFNEGEEVVATEKIHGSNARYIFTNGHMYAGSRRLWKRESSGCIWRKALRDNPWIEEWCRFHPDATLYGEVVPTQGGYDYGSNGKVKFFVFDVLGADGQWWGYGVAHDLVPKEHWVPELYYGPFMLECLMTYVDGMSKVEGAKHRREGIVIKPMVERQIRNLGRLQLKIVSNEFLSKE